jgi:hypothetical protein
MVMGAYVETRREEHGGGRGEIATDKWQLQELSPWSWSNTRASRVESRVYGYRTRCTFCTDLRDSNFFSSIIWFQ